MNTLNAVELVKLLTYQTGLSNSAASFVAVKLCEKHGLHIGGPGRKAEGHASEHGDNGSDAAQKYISSLLKLDFEKLMAWAKRKHAVIQANKYLIKAQLAAEDAHKELIRWCKNPQSEAEITAQQEAELNEWWEKEGKFEAEIEERGESKYFYYEKEKAELHGEEYTARDYLSGESA